MLGEEFEGKEEVNKVNREKNDSLYFCQATTDTHAHKHDEYDKDHEGKCKIYDVQFNLNGTDNRSHTDDPQDVENVCTYDISHSYLALASERGHDTRTYFWRGRLS
jgi:hypothetical protein